MQVSFINESYRRFFEKHRDEIMLAIEKCIAEGQFILRDEVARFEKTLAEYVGVKYAVGVNSGTDAIFLSLKALGIGPGDEVITPSNTFIASIQSIVHCGATPILTDCGEDGLMDVNAIEPLITPRTKAILPVHMYGKVSDMNKIWLTAENHKLWIIEDACQALGARYDGGEWGVRGKAGAMGDVAAFSFISPKLMGCYGDAGVAVTDREDVYEKLLLLRNHWNITQNALLGLDIKRPEIMGWGWNSRLDNIQAAVLNVKFKYIDEILERRRAIGKTYNDGLASLEATGEFRIPKQQPKQIYQEYVVRVKNRDAFAEHMKKCGVELLIRDTIPNHKLPGLGLERFDLPMTEAMALDSARLPIWPEMRDDETQYVISCVREFF